MPVIQRALFVLLRQALGRRLIRLAVKQHNALGPVVLSPLHEEFIRSLEDELTNTPRDMS